MTGVPEDEITEVRRLIAEDVVSGADALFGFSSRFAVSRALKHTSLLLKSDARLVRDSAMKAALQRDMLGLVEQVIADQASPDPEAAEHQVRIEAAMVRAAHLPVRQRGYAFEGRSLGRSFGRDGFHLHDVDLKLKLGEITGVVGENANGKTTLFRIIAGELRHTEGTVCYPALGAPSQEAINWPKVKQQIAYVPQILPRWYGSLRDNLSYAAAVHGIRGDANKAEVNYIVERLNLAEHLDKSWSALSGGFRLRFQLASALVWRPRLLILDEPLANLDFKAQSAVLQDIGDLARSYRNPIAVIMSSQHLHETEAIADNILFLRDGAVQFNGPTADIGASRTTNTFEVGADIEGAPLRAALAGIGVEHITFDGMAYQIVTGLDVTASGLVQLLLSAGIRITFFRDTSRSVKGLFAWNGERP